MKAEASGGDEPSRIARPALQRWHRFQDRFAEVLGFGLRTIGLDRSLLVDSSWPHGLDPVRLAVLFGLGEELEELLPGDALPVDTRIVSRPVGISFAAVPLRDLRERVIACLVAGPVVLGRREDVETFRSRAKGLGLDPEPRWPLLLTMRLYSFAGLRSALQLVEEVGGLLFESAASNRQSAEIVMKAGRRKAVVQQLLQSLLEAAMTATQAEGGSVMVYDSLGKVYRIAAARGLSPEIVAGARIEPGEGLVGLAAAEGAVLLLDERTEDPQLRSRMRRRDVVSSIIGPLLVESMPQRSAVLCVRTGDHRHRFTVSHLEALRGLLHLAGAALSAVQNPAELPPSLPDAGGR